MCTCTIPLSTSAAGWTLCSPSSLDCRYAQRHAHRSHTHTHSQITHSNTLTDTEPRHAALFPQDCAVCADSSDSPEHRHTQTHTDTHTHTHKTEPQNHT